MTNLILAALLAWQSFIPVIFHEDLSENSQYAGFAWAGESGVCNISVGSSWRANSWSQASIIAHEIGHCLLGRCGFWGHVSEEAWEQSIMTPAGAVYGLDRSGPTDWDRANLQTRCRQYHSQSAIHIAGLSVG